MGVLPLQFPAGETADVARPDRHGDVRHHRRHRAQRRRDARARCRSAPTPASSSTRCVRIDTPGEADYYRHGGILQYVLRKMLES